MLKANFASNIAQFNRVSLILDLNGYIEIFKDSFKAHQGLNKVRMDRMEGGQRAIAPSKISHKGHNGSGRNYTIQDHVAAYPIDEPGANGPGYRKPGEEELADTSTADSDVTQVGVGFSKG